MFLNKLTVASFVGASVPCLAALRVSLQMLRWDGQTGPRG